MGRKVAFRTLLIAGLGLAAASAGAQYPGKVKKDVADPVLRSVAVLEWVGEPGKPSASRMVPVAVFDGEHLNDGTIYLKRPEPMAVSGGVEYELQTAGKPIGLFDVVGAGESSGVWRGYGVWKPLSAVEAQKASGLYNQSSLINPVDVADDEHPVLKRKHPKGTDTDDAKPADGGKGGADTAESKGSEGNQAKDPDRPTLKRKPVDDTAAGGTGSAGSGGEGKGDSAKVEVDPERPTIRRPHRTAEEQMPATSAEPDPDRPRLKRGKPVELQAVNHQLEGYPPSMQQSVAVSDARNRSEHPWKYTWANPDDELKMKAALEGIARTALGLDAPPAPKPVRKSTTARKAVKAAAPVEPVEPVALAEEEFRVFELAYGAPATMVLTASTPDLEAPVKAAAPDDVNKADDARDAGRPAIHYGKSNPKGEVNAASTVNAAPKPAPRKFVTLIAQPDLYGGVVVLSKNVTDSAHLDEKPRMKLIDAVDAMGDNRGELLFELRGDGQRQFAMYRVLRGEAEQLFATVGMP